MMKYRSDIDGVRAIAVGLVVLFHVWHSAVPGGFIGVDVFFVISGFLITRIIVDEIRAGQFTLSAFYERRARRILPALLVMSCISLAAGFILLSPSDYSDLGKSSISAALSVSNIFFMLSTGYFDQSAELMPLLHTWSLSVEEQFYLFWPLLVLVVIRTKTVGRAGLIPAIVVVSIFSFLLGLYVLSYAPKWAFYLPFTRAWEFAAGAGVALSGVVLRGGAAQYFKVAGIGLIVVPAFSLNVDSKFPGLNAVAPVVGTALLLCPSNYNALVNRLLSASPMTFTGRISYSWYLWHWPIIVFWRHYQSGQRLGLVDGVCIIVVSFAVAYASWRYVEQPFRRVKISRAVVLSGGAFACFFTAILGLGVFVQSGFPTRVSKEHYDLRSLSAMWDWQCPQSVNVTGGWYGMCAVGASWETADRRVMLWGDSKAEHLMPLLDKVGQKHNVSILLFRGCAAILGKDGVGLYVPSIPNYYLNCQHSREMAKIILNSGNRIEGVILASVWAHLARRIYDSNRPNDDKIGIMLRALRGLRDELTLSDVALTVIGDVPHFERDPIPCVVKQGNALPLRQCSADYDTTKYKPIEIKTDEALRSLDREGGLRVMLLTDALCRAGVCDATLNGEFLYRDVGHLRRNMKSETVRLLSEKLNLDRAVTGETSTVWRR